MDDVRFNREAEFVPSVCVVTPDIVLDNPLSEVTSSMIGLAQGLAVNRCKVTILCTLKDAMAADERDLYKSYFWDKYEIVLEFLRSPSEFLYDYRTIERISFGVYRHIQEGHFDAVFLPLENGLAYYTVLAEETDVFKCRSSVVVVAHAPVEWQSHVDRSFPSDVEFAKAAFMEKYCAQHARYLAYTWSGLANWFSCRGWEVVCGSRLLPAQKPLEWLDKDVPELRTGAAAELVLVAGSRERDGILFFCDMMDELAKMGAPDLQVTAVGPFSKILGEHTGGMLLRRSRRWPVSLRLNPQLGLLEGILYAKRRGAIVVVPNSGSATGYCVSECVRLGVPFVSVLGGANSDRLDEESVARCLAEPTASCLASAVANATRCPAKAAPRLEDDTGTSLWYSYLTEIMAELQPVEKERRQSPLVSIVVTHHDRPQYLLQAINSIVDQDYPNFEVILVDDGSRLSGSGLALARLEADFATRGWRIIRTENRQVGAARNTGVNAARGELIVFVDDDNALFPEAVSTFVSALKKSESDVCMALCKSFHEATLPDCGGQYYVSHIPIGGCLDICMLGNSFGDTISIYKREVFDKAGYQIEGMENIAEDWEFFVRLTLTNHKLTLIPEALFWYRVNTNGRYKTSHYYNNITRVLQTLAEYNYVGAKNLYGIFVGQNVDQWTAESYRVNLSYSPSDANYLELAELPPNDSKAITLLAEIAASEGREDTAVALLVCAGTGQLHDRAGALFNNKPDSLAAIESAAAALTQSRRIPDWDLRRMEIWTADPSREAPLTYVDPPDRLYVEAGKAEISVAVLPGGCPVSTTSVDCQVSLPQAESLPGEFLLLLAPGHEDPVIAAEMAEATARDGCSGWQAVSDPLVGTRMEARLTVPSSEPMNLILAVRCVPNDLGRSVLGCFERIVVRTSLEDRLIRRPRQGPPPHRQRARTWSNEERRKARLVTNYRSELPLLMLPERFEAGIFLRPARAGPVVAAIERGFPTLARQIIAKVEVAHDEASPFDIAIALTPPDKTIEWHYSGPEDCTAFSDWLRISEAYTLRAITLTLPQRIHSPLTVNLAVRLPKGSSPAPANIYFRSLIFRWEE